jgi:putative ABC transport system ATP-binding protein
MDGSAPRPYSELVRLSGVHKLYGRGISGVHALYDINLAFGAGEMLAICGPCGSGKTTLMNLVGLIETANSGSVVIANLLTSQLTEHARAQLRSEMIGYVFQNFSLIPVLSAQENVLLPLTLRGRLNAGQRKDAEHLAAELLARVGLATQTHHFPSRLDAGQCQRVAIARALITQPRLVVADEPTSRLDNGSIRLVMDLFANEQRQHGTAFLIATRDQRQLSRATRTLQLAEGRLGATANETLRPPRWVQG